MTLSSNSLKYDLKVRRLIHCVVAFSCIVVVTGQWPTSVGVNCKTVWWEHKHKLLFDFKGIVGIFKFSDCQKRKIYEILTGCDGYCLDDMPWEDIRPEPALPRRPSVCGNGVRESGLYSNTNLKWMFFYSSNTLNCECWFSVFGYSVSIRVSPARVYP